jgi:hypothetical protein
MLRRMRTTCAIWTLGLVLFSASSLYAVDRVHNVTQDIWYETIQAALNDANVGDSLVALGGTYYENISWPSRDAIKLYSTYGPRYTIIDGSGAGRVVNFGTAGAGIYTSSSPTITNNIVTGNSITGEDWNYGGGIHCYYQSAPHIVHNVISFNTISGGSWNYGGGIYCDMYVTAVIERNFIAHNEATGGSRGYGVGIYSDMYATPRIANNIIALNEATAGSWNMGAGIYCYGSPDIVGNTIVYNSCQGGSWNYGGGIWCGWDCMSIITNNIIVQNSVGGGYYNYGGGIYCEPEANPTISYNDVWGNTPQNYYNCSPGVGDISQDPLFVDAPNEDFHLSPGSPCINMGDPDYIPPPDEKDYDGDPRVYEDRVDMGADEAIQWIHIVPDTTEVPRGGNLGYTITVYNCTVSDVVIDYWTDVYLWNGKSYNKNPILGPVHGTIPASSSRSKHVSHKVPTSAPLRTYACYGRIGDWPDAWYEDAFEFTVVE